MTPRPSLTLGVEEEYQIIDPVTRELRSYITQFLAAGTHPFSSWMHQEVSPFTRYYGVMEDMQYLARRLLIFGLHVHVGIEDREFLIDAMNVSRYMLPHILALSTSS